MLTKNTVPILFSPIIVITDNKKRGREYKLFTGRRTRATQKRANGTLSVNYDL